MSNQDPLRRDTISLVADISSILAQYRDPDQSLQHIAELIARALNTDVCSIYLLDSKSNRLQLQASQGLKEDSIQQIQMETHEGLTGLVVQRLDPVFVVRPAEHPRFKYFQASGEEIYSTFLGVPLVYQQQVLGVLVAQTVAETGLTSADIPLLQAVASQISSLAAYSGLLESLNRQRQESSQMQQRLSRSLQRDQARDREGFLRGEPVSEGFGQGRAHYLAASIGFEEVEAETTEHPEPELSRFEEALSAAQNGISRLIDTMDDLQAEDRAVLKAYLMLLQDRALLDRIRTYIKQGSKAEYALKTAISDYLDIFAGLEDPYLRERGRDVEDVGKRLLRALYGIDQSLNTQFESDTVIIASDISPADLVALRQDKLKAIVLTKGGRTSHAVILAKSFEIPAVIQVADVMDRVKEQDWVIVDGTSGLVFPTPTQEIRREYNRLEREKSQLNHRLARLRSLPAESLDHQRIGLGANIGLLSDLELVDKYGAEFIGLYRTEFPFLARKGFPTEEEQVELYRKVLQGAKQREVTFRTLDVGGDKVLSYLDYPPEDNPYLGWRSIRVSLDMDDIFRTQLRSILRAASSGRARIMFPMISSVQEIITCLDILKEEKKALSRRSVEHNPEVPVGIMIEVPAAVKILPKLLPWVDFISLGTNDLVQYILAVDRNNPRVAPLYTPLHPAVLGTVAEAAAICRKFGLEVSVCGEAAANLSCAYFLLGLDIQGLSMNPASIPRIKNLVRRVDRERIRNQVPDILALSGPAEIQTHLETVLQDLSLDRPAEELPWLDPQERPSSQQTSSGNI